MWTHELETVKAIQRVLKELDCQDVCPRCILRLAGVKKSYEFLKVSTEIDNTEVTTSNLNGTLIIVHFLFYKRFHLGCTC